ncbi:MAG TPA: zinc-dependent peptidase [Verrucomicrobiae bacterium]|nr:zinc-dependent peptidase [Verrucomicrobiae bacterium]
MIFGILKRRRRKRLRARPFPREWDLLLRRRWETYSLLPEADRLELQGHVQVLLAEKRFEGCSGQEVDEEMRVLVAAQASLLLLHRETDYFPRLVAILIYPGSFRSPRQHRDEVGVVTEHHEVLSGESWERGTVVLAWDEVRRGMRGRGDGYNVVLHEFAHQIDCENGPADGCPGLSRGQARADWARVLGEAFEELRRESDRGRWTFLDPYGAQDPAEFFAVATESFFQCPEETRSEMPALYEQLRRFYCQDPAGWSWDSRRKP